ncbi:E3 SUMO-protein ligase PIAS1 [Fistulifera solaris]|uniref:E3 SUMO-protein ligase PIAS1 n=1 Tax=Fistulifera solaris TaxID=1519565 RepID=A0A1Z5J808_FISSO|nr:E3 SUMO-protein ligase PIAS1 [Fistulifera solaris]|eukprot:GAX10125.1 E3 SUMO-protein ligase PIAS1 [Fistulifera solaris]
MVEPRGERERTTTSSEGTEEDAMVQRILEMRRKDCDLLEKNVLAELVREKWQQLKPVSKETDAKEQFIILLQLCFQRAADETLSVKNRRVAIESVKSLLEKLESHVATKKKNHRREEEEDEGNSRQSLSDSPVPSIVEGIPQPTAKPPSAVHQPKPKRSNAVEFSGRTQANHRTTAPPQIGWSQTKNQTRASEPSNLFNQPLRNVPENVDRLQSKQDGSSLAASSSTSQSGASQHLSVGRIDRTTDSSQPLSALPKGNSSMSTATISRRMAQSDLEPLPLLQNNNDRRSSLSAATTSQTDMEPLPFSVLQQNGDLEPIPLSALPQQQQHQSDVSMSGRLVGMPHGDNFQRQNGNFTPPSATYASMARIGWSASQNAHHIQHSLNGRAVGLHPRMPFPVRQPAPMQPSRNNHARSPALETATSPFHPVRNNDNGTLSASASTTLPTATSAHSQGQPTPSEQGVPRAASNRTSATETTTLATASASPAHKDTHERLSAPTNTNTPTASEPSSQKNAQEMLPPDVNTNAFVAASAPSATGAVEKPLVDIFMESWEKNTSPKVQTTHFPPDLGVPIGQKLKTRSGLLETRINSLKITCRPKPTTKVMAQIVDRRIREWEPYRNPIAYVSMGLTSAVESCLPEGNFARTTFSTQIDLSRSKFNIAGKYPTTLANYPGIHWGTKVENLELALIMFPLKRNEKEQSKRADGHIWPKGSFLVVQSNPQELQQRRQESHDRSLWKGCSAPLDLAPLIKDPKRQIKIDLCSYDEDIYFYCVMLCSIQTPDALYRQLTQPGPLALERVSRDQAMKIAVTIARRQVVQLDCDDDMDTETGKLVFSLLCPLSKTAMETPVRSSKCSHWQCFDLKFFLETNRYISGARWRCGACDPRFVSPRELRICGLTADMIQEYKDEISALRNRVELSEDGTYRLLEEKKVRHRGVKRAQSADGNEVKPKRNQIQEAIIID